MCVLTDCPTCQRVSFLAEHEQLVEERPSGWFTWDGREWLWLGKCADEPSAINNETKGAAA